MPQELYKTISELVEVGRLFYQRGWLPATGGNLSARLEDQRVLITASGSHKGHLTAEDFVVVDLEGNLVKGSKKPSAETLLHLLVYRLFPEAKCVLHIHSLSSTLISRLFKEGILLRDYELLKAFAGINTHEVEVWVPVFENHQDMKRLSGLIEEGIKGKERLYGFLLRSHGLYTWGNSIKEATVRVEAFEFLFECELKLLSLGGGA